MNSGKCIEELYKLMNQKLGKKAAKEAVDAMVFLVITDLEQEGLEISESNLSKRFSDYVRDFIDASKEDVA